MLDLKDRKQVLSLKEKIDKHEYVSFDMFDTLVKRDCWRPIEMFQFVQKKVDEAFHIDSNFAALRVEAERKAIRSSQYEEITLDEIYEQMDANLPREDIQQVKQWEEEYEFECCQWNPYIRPIYEYCVAQHKKILVITDIYLPYQLIERILKKLGINYDALYVSSDKLLRKDTTSLFRYVLKEQNIRPSSLLHIGDNKKSDFRSPKKLGIDVVHIARDLSLNLFINKNLYKHNHDYANLCTFINNHADLHSWDAVHPDKAEDYFAQAGYEAEGPVLYGFVKWLQEQFKKDHIEKVFFLARDGQIMQKAYQQLADNLPNTYMYASRKAFIVPYLWMHTNLHDFEHIMFWRRRLTIKTFLEKIGLSAKKFLHYYEEKDFDLNIKYTWHSLLKNHSFLEIYENYIKEAMVKNSKQQYNYLIRYLKQINFTGKVAIVDIGWFGHMQAALQSIINIENFPVEINGYYLGLRANSSVLGDNIKAKGYLFGKNHYEDLCDIEAMFNCIVEALFTANHGTTLGYKCEENDIVPILEQWEYADKHFQQDYQWIKAAQTGALAFMSDALKEKITLPLADNSMAAFSNWLCLGCHPSTTCVKKIGNLHMLDDDIRSFVLSTDREESSLKSLILNFKDSSWRIGYLASLLGDNLPVFSFYKILRKLVKMMGIHA